DLYVEVLGDKNCLDVIKRQNVKDIFAKTSYGPLLQITHRHEVGQRNPDLLQKQPDVSERWEKINVEKLHRKALARSNPEKIRESFYAVCPPGQEPYVTDEILQRLFRLEDPYNSDDRVEFKFESSQHNDCELAIALATALKLNTSASYRVLTNYMDRLN